jgi:hypothetical protein
MKKIFKYIFIYLITASIFVSGNGVVLSIHTCLSSSCKNVSLFHEKSCCSDKKSKCNSGIPNHKDKISSKCCTSEVSFHKLNIPFVSQKSPKVPGLKFISSPVFSVSELVKNEFVHFYFVPPPDSFSRLIAYHQLLI